jgi:alpha-beta hydrolase superfamily lysophospholipase
MHGRTVSKELDPGRYLRWIRAGIAAVALDLPGHGDRLDPDLQRPQRTLDVLDQMTREIDPVFDALASPDFANVLDLDRCGIGGMSAGGMATLRRLCDGHDFIAAAVECTTGWLERLYFPADGRTPWGVSHDRPRVMALDAMSHLSTFRPIPLLALHATTDQVVPFQTQQAFVDSLRTHYAHQGADPNTVRLHSWESTGAPSEHAGFGRFANDAKNLQVDFLAAALSATPPSAGEFE